MNMNAIMQQAQKMQKDIENKQKEINETEYTGTSELVDIIIYGSKKIKSVKFKNMDNFSADDLEILEDMVKIAFNSAVSKVDADMESKLGPYAKQLGGLM